MESAQRLERSGRGSFGCTLRASVRWPGQERLVPSCPRSGPLRRPDVDGPAPCSAAPSSRRACGGGTDLVPRPRTAASHPLGSRCGTRLSRVSRGGRRAALDPDLEPLPSTDFRELGREAAPAVADLQWRVQSGPYFRGEGDGDSPAGWKHRPLPVPAAHAPPAGQRHLLPCPARVLPAAPSLAAEKEASCLIPPAARQCLPLIRPCRPRPPPADVAVARQSPALPAGALQQRLPTAGSRAPPCQGPCALTQAWPRSGSSLHPSWSPPLSCPACRRLPLTPALDACRCYRPPVPSSADADVAAFARAHGPPLRDPSDW
ncbi:uncharacterized protein [Manis javanica]|uniref:uncharacterized protein n=1 Tax=Manis javanica TaxID=9974 RepID=UPI003C6DB384